MIKAFVDPNYGLGYWAPDEEFMERDDETLLRVETALEDEIMRELKAIGITDKLAKGFPKLVANKKIDLQRRLVFLYDARLTVNNQLCDRGFNNISERTNHPLMVKVAKLLEIYQPQLNALD